MDGSEKPVWQRLKKLKDVQTKMAKQVEEATQASNKEGEREQERGGGVKVPSHSRKAESEMVQEMLQRNTVLVEAATNRLRGLGVNIPPAVDGDR